MSVKCSFVDWHGGHKVFVQWCCPDQVFHDTKSQNWLHYTVSFQWYSLAALQMKIAKFKTQYNSWIFIACPPCIEHERIWQDNLPISQWKSVFLTFCFSMQSVPFYFTALIGFYNNNKKRGKLKSRCPFWDDF